jgi:uncharacterized protein (TIGR01440 family)
MDRQKLLNQLATLREEWLQSNYLKQGELFIVGCSTSEVAGERIGTAGSEEIAVVIYNELLKLQKKSGIQLCFQCCEHLNRAIVMERSTMEQFHLEEVTVIPVPNAGGAMAAYAFKQLENPVVVESVVAHAGMDIGETMIGMHLKSVAVPLRFTERFIGNARITAAYTRPKRIGGARAVYPKA